MTHVEVLVVGAGFAGIAAAAELRRAGRDVAVIERADQIGGTWRDNVYPGIACDVPADLYTLARHPRSGALRRYASGAEIRDYLVRVVEAEGLASVIQTGVDLRSAHWDGVWRTETTGGGPTSADVLVLACGRLSDPKIPTIPGLSSFGGPIAHTARWEDGLLDAGEIAVVGTGASAVQLVPELVRRGASVTLFQRSAPWILPREDAPADPADTRERLRAAAAAAYPARSGDPEASNAARRTALAHLRRQVPDPRLRAALTPGYAFGCKRVLLSDAFYPAVASDRVTLEPSALARVEGSDLVAASGARYRADAIVLATGFDAATPSYATRITGEDGQTLAERWSSGMEAYGGALTDGFPDLVVVGGPNAALSYTSSLLMIEAQLDLVGRALASRAASGAPLRVHPGAVADYTARVDARAAGSPWLSGCQNWYVDPRSGRLTVAWPGTVSDYESDVSAPLDRVLQDVEAGVMR